MIMEYDMSDNTCNLDMFDSIEKMLKNIKKKMYPGIRFENICVDFDR
jgi:hypothetical protein